MNHVIVVLKKNDNGDFEVYFEGEPHEFGFEPDDYGKEITLKVSLVENQIIYHNGSEFYTRHNIDGVEYTKNHYYNDVLFLTKIGYKLSEEAVQEAVRRWGKRMKKYQISL